MLVKGQAGAGGVSRSYGPPTNEKTRSHTNRLIPSLEMLR